LQDGEGIVTHVRFSSRISIDIHKKQFTKQRPIIKIGRNDRMLNELMEMIPVKDDVDLKDVELKLGPQFWLSLVIFYDIKLSSYHQLNIFSYFLG